MVAELSFGFWRFLRDRRYQTTLWPQALRFAFPHQGSSTRREIYAAVNDLHRLRNRIAHHEPIHHLPLAARHLQLLRVVGHIDPAVQAWISGLSRVPELLRAWP